MRISFVRVLLTCGWGISLLVNSAAAQSSATGGDAAAASSSATPAEAATQAQETTAAPQTLVAQLDRPVAVVAVPAAAGDEAATVAVVAEAGRAQLVAVDRQARTSVLISGFAPLAAAPGDAVPWELGNSVGAVAWQDQSGLIAAGHSAADDRSALRSFPLEPAQSYDAGTLLWQSATAGQREVPWSLLRTSSSIWSARRAPDGPRLAERVRLPSSGAETTELAERQSLGELAGLRPCGVTASPRDEVVVTTTGAAGATADSRLIFLHPRDGRVLLNVATDRLDLVAIAYSPRGLLYGVDFAHAAADQAGLYRLDAVRDNGQLTVRSTKIAALQRPTSLSFTRDGSLYVTQWGAVDAAAPAGSLVLLPTGL